MESLRALITELRECGTAEVTPWFVRSLGYSAELLATTLGATAEWDGRRWVLTLRPPVRRC
jgi:hypothetical protein